MTNKLVVIINILKVPKIKKILLYEMKFLVPNYSCLQNPWIGGYRPQIPVLSLSSVLNWICWTPPKQNSWLRHCPVQHCTYSIYTVTPTQTHQATNTYWICITFVKRFPQKPPQIYMHDIKPYSNGLSRTQQNWMCSQFLRRYARKISAVLRSQ